MNPRFRLYEVKRVSRRQFAVINRFSKKELARYKGKIVAEFAAKQMERGQ